MLRILHAKLKNSLLTRRLPKATFFILADVMAITSCRHLAVYNGGKQHKKRGLFMAWTSRDFLLGVHLVAAIMWVGGVAFIGWAVYPASRFMRPLQRQQFFRSLMQWSHRPLAAAGAVVITTGIWLGTAAGPIHSWADVWLTAYGRVWLTALLTGTATLAWGMFVGYRKAMTVFADEELWQQAEHGNDAPLKNAMTSIIAIQSVEAAGFVVLILCMLLLS
ncbi:hypothetical protein GTNG_3365 [Geobacillus thermodenitrificans NG80-2]|uniref:Copper resistance protein D domain-containing protein n=2 Tax=Geobacillus thermodenitrificans TaxID=33940 RepID=A4ITP8_GEOTN|nr:hypothetical protein GTNG_3365 [Geobacillus thermodenitrificans NG80-2]